MQIFSQNGQLLPNYVQYFGPNIVEDVAESWVETEMSWVEVEMSWVELEGAEWRWMEMDGAGCTV